MDRRIGGIVGSLLLILAGVAALAIQFVPGWSVWFQAENAWPLFVIGAGLVLFCIGLAAGAPGMAVPACIVSGIGGLLFWQNATGSFDSWSYAWALIPGFVGVGIILSGLLQGSTKEFGGGAWLIFISLVLFSVFGSFLGGVSVFGPYWPVLIIVLGVVMLARRVIWAR